MATGELWLSRDEIAQMCRASTKKLQLEFLRLNGIRHYVDRHGRPVVSRAVVEANGTIPKASEVGEWQSNKFKAA